MIKLKLNNCFEITDKKFNTDTITYIPFSAIKYIESRSSDSNLVRLFISESASMPLNMSYPENVKKMDEYILWLKPNNNILN